MKLLVGLGNPGNRYAHTRHNLGWDLLLHLVARAGFSLSQKRFHGRFGDGRIGGERLFALLPETYMNRSGLAVGEAANFYKLDPDEVIVFHDDLDLPLGRVKMKSGGGNAGHNGLKSIQQALGSPDFGRVRLGIGRPPGRMPPAKFVLDPFNRDERQLVETLADALADVADAIVASDWSTAMNRIAPQLPSLEKPAQGGG